MGYLHRLVILLPPVDEAELAARMGDVHGELPDHVQGALAVIVESGNRLIAYTGARRDEWHYHCAIEQAVRSRVESDSATRGQPRPASIDVRLQDGPIVLGRVFYLRVGDRTLGPVTILAVRRMARLGRVGGSATSRPKRAQAVNARTPVYDGKRWRRLGELPEVYSNKQRSVALILSLLLGVVGADRFYLHRFGSGVVKALTLGMCGTWWLLDLTFLLARVTTDKAGRPLR
jgi:hypothetical protein